MALTSYSVNVMQFNGMEFTNCKQTFSIHTHAHTQGSSWSIHDYKQIFPSKSEYKMSVIYFMVSGEVIINASIKVLVDVNC